MLRCRGPARQRDAARSWVHQLQQVKHAVDGGVRVDKASLIHSEPEEESAGEVSDVDGEALGVLRDDFPSA